MKKLLITFALMFMIASPVHAAPESHGTITKLYLKRGDGLVLFKLSSTPPAVCAAVDAGNPFMFYTTSTAGKETYATLLSAYMSGKTVKVGYGGGTTSRCSVVYVYFN